MNTGAGSALLARGVEMRDIRIHERRVARARERLRLPKLPVPLGSLPESPLMVVLARPELRQIGPRHDRVFRNRERPHPRQRCLYPSGFSRARTTPSPSASATRTHRQCQPWANSAEWDPTAAPPRHTRPGERSLLHRGRPSVCLYGIIDDGIVEQKEKPLFQRHFSYFKPVSISLAGGFGCVIDHILAGSSHHYEDHFYIRIGAASNDRDHPGKCHWRCGVHRERLESNVNTCIR